MEALQRLNAVQAEQIEALKGGGGGGTSGGGMEARIARLESDMEHVKKGVERLDAATGEIKKTVTAIQLDVSKGVGEIKAELGKITERAKHFPTKWEVFGIVTGLLLFAIAIFGVAAKIVGG